MTQSANNVEQVLAEHIARLRASLQHVSGDSDGPEEGSDAWLLLDALVKNDEDDNELLTSRLEQSGRWLAEQGGKIDARLRGLQHYVDTLASELKKIFITQPELLTEAILRLYRLHSVCVLALTRGYQEVTDQFMADKLQATGRLEHRLVALQRINGVSNSTMDLDQTLEVTAQVVAEELQVDLCSIFFYDELQRMLTL
ncbi:MAG TPA: hypothetical protein VII61_23930, partial [Ktedonobacteraceae bacterium]